MKREGRWPTEPARDSRPGTWGSRCYGWPGGAHERLRVEPGGWRCRWCFQLLEPPRAAPRRSHDA